MHIGEGCPSDHCVVTPRRRLENLGRLEKRCWLNRNLHGLVTTRFAKMVISPSRFPYGFSIECAGTGVFFLLEDCPITAPSFLCQLKTGITTHRYKWGVFTQFHPSQAQIQLVNFIEKSDISPPTQNGKNAVLTFNFFPVRSLDRPFPLGAALQKLPVPLAWLLCRGGGRYQRG